jgi:hypothetical protein
MGRYRSKPYEVEAWQFTGPTAPLPEFVMDAARAGKVIGISEFGGSHRIVIVSNGSSGEHEAIPGDWIIKTATGIFSLDPLTFKKQFEPADAATSIERNQIITPAQLPGKDEHTLERIDGADEREDLGPPVTMAPYRRPADTRVQGLLDDAKRQRQAEGRRETPAATRKEIYTDPRLAPDYKPPKKPTR